MSCIKKLPLWSVKFIFLTILCWVLSDSLYAQSVDLQKEAFINNFTRLTPRNDWYNNSSIGFLIEECVGSEDNFAALVKRGQVDWVTVACEISGAVFYPSKLSTEVIQRNLKMDYMRFCRDLAKKYGVKYLAGFYGFRHHYAPQSHPEWAVVNADGSRRRDLLCPNTRFTEDLMLAQIREVYEMYQTDGFWFDCDNWIVTPCYCDNCLKMFREQYGIEAPRNAKDPNWDKFMEFRRKSFVNYSKKVGDLIHSFGPNMTYVTNWGYTFLQPEPVPDFIDFLSSDIGGERRTEMVSFLAHYHDAERVPWDAMVSNWITGTGKWNGPDFRPKSPDYLNQEYAVAFSHGGRAHIWSSRDRNGPGGEDYIPPYDIILTEQLANFVHSRDEVFKGTEPVRRVAVLHSASTFYKDGRGLYGHGPVLDRIAGANLALRQNHLHFQILNEEYLLENLDSYKVVVLSQQTTLSERVTDALRRWVDRGGSLVVTGLSATGKDFFGKPSMTLGDVLGIEFANADTINPGLIAVGPIPIKMSLTVPFYPVQLKSAGTLVPLQKDHNPYDNEILQYPAVTINQFGKGKGIYIATDLFTRYWSFQEPGVLRILDKVMKEADPFPQIETDAPKAITFALRKKARNLIANIVNEGTDWDMNAPGAFYVENVPPVGPFSVKIRCSNKPTRVYGVPDVGPMEWHWDTDGVWIKVPGVHIHQGVVLEKAFEK